MDCCKPIWWYGYVDEIGETTGYVPYQPKLCCRRCNQGGKVFSRPITILKYSNYLHWSQVYILALNGLYRVPPKKEALNTLFIFDECNWPVYSITISLERCTQNVIICIAPGKRVWPLSNLERQFQLFHPLIINLPQQQKNYVSRFIGLSKEKFTKETRKDIVMLSMLHAKRFVSEFRISNYTSLSFYYPIGWVGKIHYLQDIMIGNMTLAF